MPRREHGRLVPSGVALCSWRRRRGGDINGRVSSELADAFRVPRRRAGPCRACGRAGGLVRSIETRVTELLSRELFVSVCPCFASLLPVSAHFFSHIHPHSFTTFTGNVTQLVFHQA